jgi:hypothetical protein
MWYDGATGKLNASLGFDGSNDTVSMGDVLDFDYNQPFSAGAWIKTSLDTGMSVITKQDSGGSFSGWNLQVAAGGKIYFQLVNTYCTSGNCIEVYTTDDLNYDDGNWHHVMFTYDGSGAGSGVNLYFDGKLVAKTVFSASLSTSTVNAIPLYIGSRNGATQFFSGQIDDPRVFNYALSANQVRKLMQDSSVVRFGPAVGEP